MGNIWNEKLSFIVKIIPNQGEYRTIKKKVNFVFYLIGFTKRAIPIISGSLIVSTTSIISLWLLILSCTNFFLLAVPLVKSR